VINVLCLLFLKAAKEGFAMVLAMPVASSRPLKAKLNVAKRKNAPAVYRAVIKSEDLAAHGIDKADRIQIKLIGSVAKGREPPETDEFVSKANKWGRDIAVTVPASLIHAKGLEKAEEVSIKLLGKAGEERVQRRRATPQPRRPGTTSSTVETPSTEGLEERVCNAVAQQLEKMLEPLRKQLERGSQPLPGELAQMKEQVSKSVTEIEKKIAGLEATVDGLSKSVEELKTQVQDSTALREKLDGLEKKIADLVKPPEVPKPAEAKPPTRAVGVVPPPLFQERRVSLAPVEVKVVREEPPPYTPPPPPSWRVEETLMDGVVKLWDEKDAFVAAVATKPQWFCSHCKIGYCKHVAFTREWLKTQKR
jgi:uncharacterized coiled-coil protein SlyX